MWPVGRPWKYGETMIHIRRTFTGQQVTIVEVRGDLVGSEGETLRRYLESLQREHPQMRVHLDLHLVGKADADACWSLVEAGDRLKAFGGSLAITGAPERVRGTLSQLAAA